MRLVTGLLLLLSFSALSGVENFEKRFKFVRNADGSLHTVKMKSARSMNAISVNGFWQSLKREIQEFQDAAKNRDRLNEDLKRIEESLRSEEFSFSGGEKGLEEKESLKKSLKNLRKVDLKEVFAQIEKSEFIKKFQAKLKEAFAFVDPAIIARPDHSSFFYKRNAGNQVAKWALNFINDRFSSVPVLNTAVFVVNKLMKFVADKRAFHQNIFLYYTEVYSAEELGMTKEEVDQVVSSIFESRIALTGFQESKAAQANWMNYGFDKFYKLVRQANAKRRSLEKVYGGVGARLGYAFNFVEDDRSSKIVNLFEKAHMFTSKPAVAFDFINPAKVLMTRNLVYLAQLGLSFVPLPGIVKTAANAVADSFYCDQGKTEGALVGYFEDKGEQKFANLLIQQSVNPFLMAQ